MLNMNKSEAIERVKNRLKMPVLLTSSIHFANINPSKNVWWLDIPLSKLTKEGIPNISLLLYDNINDKLHYIVIPKVYFQENMERFAVRHNKGCISIELSTDEAKIFRDMRPGGYGINFRKYLIETC